MNTPPTLKHCASRTVYLTTDGPEKMKRTVYRFEGGWTVFYQGRTWFIRRHKDRLVLDKQWIPASRRGNRA